MSKKKTEYIYVNDFIHKYIPSDVLITLRDGGNKSKKNIDKGKAIIMAIRKKYDIK